MNFSLVCGWVGSLFVGWRIAIPQTFFLPSSELQSKLKNPPKIAENRPGASGKDSGGHSGESTGAVGLDADGGTASSARFGRNARRPASTTAHALRTRHTSQTAPSVSAEPARRRAPFPAGGVKPAPPLSPLAGPCVSMTRAQTNPPTLAAQHKPIASDNTDLDILLRQGR